MPKIDANFIKSLKNSNDKTLAYTKGLCYSYIYPYVNDHDAAKDIVSTAMEKILRSIPTYNARKGKGTIESNFRKWLKTIVRNVYLDYRDRKQREISFSELSSALGFDDRDSSLMGTDSDTLLEMLSSNAYENYSFKDNPLWNIAVKEVIGVIAGVSEPRKKIALILKFVYGFKTKDIAEILNENFDSIQSVIHRSTLELRDLYIKKGIDVSYLDPDSWKITQAV